MCNGALLNVFLLWLTCPIVTGSKRLEQLRLFLVLKIACILKICPNLLSAVDALVFLV